jgi:hypothetical protein
MKARIFLTQRNPTKKCPPPHPLLGTEARNNVDYYNIFTYMRHLEPHLSHKIVIRNTDEISIDDYPDCTLLEVEDTQRKSSTVQGPFVPMREGTTTV